MFTDDEALVSEDGKEGEKASTTTIGPQDFLFGETYGVVSMRYGGSSTRYA